VRGVCRPEVSNAGRGVGLYRPKIKLISDARSSVGYGNLRNLRCNVRKRRFALTQGY
jgi:hypothetical protein